jgi:hypothetical protein
MGVNDRQKRSAGLQPAFDAGNSLIGKIENHLTAATLREG